MPPPPLTRFIHYPITAGTALMAIGVTAMSMAGREIDPFVMNVLAFEGEPWRLVSSILPHGSIVHLLFNVIWLWVFGTAIETVWGPVRTLALFVLFAVGSSLAEYAVFDGGIGLSGVGYGLFGLLAVLSRRDRRFAGAIDARTVRLFIFWFFLCIVFTVTDVMRIGNVAHGSGGVMGALAGLALTERKLATRIASGLAIAAIVAGSALGATIYRPVVNQSKTGGADSALLGYDLLGTKQYAEAEHHLRRAIAINDNDMASWFNLGIVLENQEDEPGAFAAYRRAYQLDPKDAGHRSAAARMAISLGVTRADNDDHEGAVAFYEKALTLDPKSDVAWYDLSIAHTKLEHFDAALDAARKAYEIKSSDEHKTRLSHALEDSGSLSREHNEIDRAIAFYQEAIKLTPDHDLYAALGWLLDMQGRDDEAREAFAKARELAVPPPDDARSSPGAKPPSDKSPAGKSADKSPVDKPPVDKPPVDKPPVDKSPVDKPPIDKPPVDKPR